MIKLSYSPKEKKFKAERSVYVMLTLQKLEDAGRGFQKAYQEAYGLDPNYKVQVERVQDGNRDAIVRIDKAWVMAVSVKDNGMLCTALGKPVRSAEFQQHGQWKVVDEEGDTYMVDLLEYVNRRT